MLTIPEHAIWNAREKPSIHSLIRFDFCVPQTIPTFQAEYMLPGSSDSTV